MVDSETGTDLVRRSRRTKSAIAGWALLAPAMLLIVGLRLVPMLMAVGLSFTDTNVASAAAAQFVGFQNYATVIGSEDFPSALFVTVAIVVPALVLEMLIGLSIALWLNRPSTGRKAARPGSRDLGDQSVSVSVRLPAVPDGRDILGDHPVAGRDHHGGADRLGAPADERGQGGAAMKTTMHVLRRIGNAIAAVLPVVASLHPVAWLLAISLQPAKSAYTMPTSGCSSPTSAPTPSFSPTLSSSRH